MYTNGEGNGFEVPVLAKEGGKYEFFLFFQDEELGKASIEVEEEIVVEEEKEEEEVVEEEKEEEVVEEEVVVEEVKGRERGFTAVESTITVHLTEGDRFFSFFLFVCFYFFHIFYFNFFYFQK